MPSTLTHEWKEALANKEVRKQGRSHAPLLLLRREGSQKRSQRKYLRGLRHEKLGKILLYYYFREATPRHDTTQSTHTMNDVMSRHLEHDMVAHLVKTLQLVFESFIRE